MIGAGAESHADADFAGAAGYGVSHDAVDADASEDEGEQAEASGEAGEDAFIGEAGVDLLGHGANFDERQVGIKRGYGGADLIDDAVGVGEGTNLDDHGTGVFRFLPVGKIEERWRGGTKVGVQVRRRSDDLGGVIGVFAPEGLADGVLVGEVFLGEGLIDDCYFRCGCGVMGVEAASVQDGDAEGVEEVRADDVHLDALLALDGPAGDMKRRAGVAVADDGDGAKRDRADAGDSGELLFEPAIEFGDLRAGVAGVRRIETEEEDVVRLEAERGVAEVDERADESQPR